MSDNKIDIIAEPGVESGEIELGPYATGADIVSSNYASSVLRLFLRWNSTADTNNNTSTVNVTLYCRSYSFTKTAATNATITINGNSKTEKVAKTVNSPNSTSDTWLMSHSVTVPHNADGTKTISISGSWAINITYRIATNEYVGTMNVSGNITLDKINRNSPPNWTQNSMTLYLMGTGYTDASKTYIIPENLDYVTARAANASDPNGDSIHYCIDKITNGNYVNIKDYDANQEITDMAIISQGNAVWKYSCYARDYLGNASGDRFSASVRRNVPSAPTILNIGKITATASNVTFYLGQSYNGFTIGNSVSLCNQNFRYSLTCLTNNSFLNNANNLSAGDVSIALATSGSGPWLNINSLKQHFASAGYIGSLSFRLSSTNDYGSTVITEFSMDVDLRASASGGSITNVTGDFSSMSGVFFPSKNPITVHWSAGSVNTSETIYYDLQYKYSDTSAWITAASNLTSTSATINTIVFTSTSARNIDLKVVYKTSGGSTTATKTITVHYWAPPTIQFTSVTRTSTSVNVNGTITLNTSYTGMSIASASYTGKSNGSPTLGGSGLNRTFSYSFSGLNATESFTTTVSVKDTLMNSIANHNATTASYQVVGEQPMFSIEKQGVSVNQSATLNSGYTFVVNGSANIKGNLHVNGSPVTGGGGGSSVATTMGSALTSTALEASDKTILGASSNAASLGNGSLDYVYLQAKTDDGIKIAIAGTTVRSVYHEGHKPGLNEIGQGIYSGDMTIGGGLTLDHSWVQATGSEVQFKNKNSNRGLFINADDAGIYDWAKDRFGIFNCGGLKVNGSLMGNFPSQSGYGYQGNLNDLPNTGIWGWSPPATNYPGGQTWGVVLQMSPNGQDKFQLAFGANGSLHKRGNLNGSWTGWTQIAG